MRPHRTIYPALGRFFETTQEIADAGCMSRTTAWECLKGKKSFTPQQKAAIENAILAKAMRKEIDPEEELIGMIEARKSFDEVFKVKEAS